MPLNPSGKRLVQELTSVLPLPPPWAGCAYLYHNAMLGKEHFTVPLGVYLGKIPLSSLVFGGSLKVLWRLLKENVCRRGFLRECKRIQLSDPHVTVMSLGSHAFSLSSNLTFAVSHLSSAKCS